MEKYQKLTDEKIIKFNNYSNDNRPQMKLIDAMNYSLKGGKRIRPVLVYGFCEALGGNIDNAVAPACAVEMIHTSAFIHDDLPALDNDDIRRGKDASHKKFGESLAILSGDALSVLPFEVIADAPELTADQKVLIISVLANSVGRDGMIGGQVIDIESRGRDDITEEEIMNMYRCKKGQLIAVSCVIGAICADGGNENLRAAAEFGLRLGLAYQIIDDIIDATGGKPADNASVVALYGVEKAREMAVKITAEALEWIDNIDDNGFLKELTAYLLDRTK
jgi:geranylgeranyl diphosphate synthase type II